MKCLHICIHLCPSVVKILFNCIVTVGRDFPKQFADEPLNLGSLEAVAQTVLSAWQAELRLADWQSAAALLTRPQAHLRDVWCLEFGAFERGRLGVRGRASQW